MKQHNSKKTAATVVSLLFALLFSLFTHTLHAQHTTPTINGTIGASEYGVHTNGENQQQSGGQTWYVTWDDNNLYFGITNANTNEAAVIYIDTNPIIPINGGDNADGTIVGQAYDNTNFAELPFRANVAMYVRGGGFPYREYRLSNGSGGWGTNVTGFGAFAETDGNNREFSFPWSAVGGRPASFAWFGYVTSSGGFVFGQVPTENAGGTIGTSARYSRYYIVNNTENSTSTKPFSRNSYVFNGTLDITDFGSITVYDFTMNTASRTITRANDASSWTINGALRIYQGTVSFGSNSGSCTVNDSIAVASGGTLTLSSTSNALTVNGNFRIDGTFTPNLSTVRFAGTGTQSVGGTSDPIEFRDVVVSKPDSRIVLTLPSTIDYFNGLHFGQNTVLQRNFILDSGLVFFSPPTGSGTFTHNIQGNLRLGSAASSVFQPTLSTVRTNTAVVINDRTNTTVNMTLNGNLEAGASGSGRVALILTGANSGTGTNVDFQVEGDFVFTSRPLDWACNTSPTGVSSCLMKIVSPTVELGNTSTFNGNRPGTFNPTIRFQGKSTITIPPSVFLGAGSTIGGTNAQANWEFTNNATLTSGSAIAINMGRTLTLDGTLTCEDGAQLIGTATGPSSGNPTLVMGASGFLQVADVDGLGNGTLIGSPNDSATPSNATLFFRQKAPAQLLQPTNPVPTNWILSSINSTGTIEYNGSNPQVITPRNGSNVYFNLTVSGASKTLGGTTVVENILDLTNVVISTGSDSLVTNAPGDVIFRTDGYINGKLTRKIDDENDQTSFPIGDASAYRGVRFRTQMTFPSTTFFTGRVVQGNAEVLAPLNAPLNRVSRLRYFEFRNDGAKALEILDVQEFQVNSDDSVGSLNPNNTLRLAFRTSGNWSEANLTTTPNTTSLPIEVSADSIDANISSSQQFFLALATTNIGDNPLPVELLSFTATSTAQGVRLAWETASEHESRGFTLLRKPHGESTWTEVASYQTDNALRSLNALNGASYSFTDKTPLEVGKSYDYQLRETGFDGQVATLETVTLTVRFNVARAFELAQNYPNPFNPVTMIRYQIPTAETVSLKVYDVLGKEVATLVSGRQEAGNYAVPFNASGLSSGMYFYRLQAGSFVETRKMMLVK